jgi:DnaJ family protein C protein 17
MTEEIKYDWYKIVECDVNASKEQISTSLRKLARKYHPDKNPDPAAAATFLLIQKAKEILLDESARAAYDTAYKAVGKRKEYDEKRKSQMDVNKKRMRDELEERMKSASKPAASRASGTESKRERALREEEIRNLRRENLEKMQAHGEEVRRREYEAHTLYENERQEQRKRMAVASDTCAIKVRWRISDASHTEESLAQTFRSYGSIESVTVGGSKRNSATIIFSDASSATRAVDENFDSQIFKVSKFDEPKRADIFTHVYNNGQNGEMQSSSNLMPHVKRAAEINSIEKNLSSASAATAFPFKSSISASDLASKESDILKKMMEVAALKRKAAVQTDQSTIEIASTANEIKTQIET